MGGSYDPIVVAIGAATLIKFNEETEVIMKMVNYLIDSGLVIKGANKAIKN